MPAQEIVGLAVVREDIGKTPRMAQPFQDGGRPASTLGAEAVSGPGQIKD